MFTIIFGLFLVLHGLVHLLYFGHSRRIFELRPGLVWPDGAWAFSRLLGDETTRLLASTALVIAAAGFIVGGAGLILKQEWWQSVVAGVAVFAAVLTILLWDGSRQNLNDQGAIGLLIDLGILMLCAWL